MLNCTISPRKVPADLRRIIRKKIPAAYAGTMAGNVIIVQAMVGRVTFNKERDLFGIRYVVKGGRP